MERTEIIEPRFDGRNAIAGPRATLIYAVIVIVRDDGFALIERKVTSDKVPDQDSPIRAHDRNVRVSLKDQRLLTQR